MVDETTELENVGDVMVCAEVVDGNLAREAVVTVTSSDGSAIGMYVTSFEQHLMLYNFSLIPYLIKPGSQDDAITIYLRDIIIVNYFLVYSLYILALLRINYSSLHYDTFALNIVDEHPLVAILSTSIH